MRATERGSGRVWSQTARGTIPHVRQGRMGSDPGPRDPNHQLWPLILYFVLKMTLNAAETLKRGLKRRRVTGACPHSRAT